MNESVTIEQLAKKIEGLTDLVKQGFIHINAKFQVFEIKLHEVADSVETLAIMTAKRFEEADENFVALRQAIMAINDKFPSQYKFDELTHRVLVLEDVVLPKDV